MLRRAARLILTRYTILAFLRLNFDACLCSLLLSLGLTTTLLLGRSRFDSNLLVAANATVLVLVGLLGSLLAGWGALLDATTVWRAYRTGRTAELLILDLAPASPHDASIFVAQVGGDGLSIELTRVSRSDFEMKGRNTDLNVAGEVLHDGDDESSLALREADRAAARGVIVGHCACMVGLFV